jgi:hypothetical protein
MLSQSPKGDSSPLVHVGWVSIFMQLSSWLVFFIGVLYMLLGVCCLKGVRDRLKQQEVESWKRYRRDLRRWRLLNE